VPDVCAQEKDSEVVAPVRAAANSPPLTSSTPLCAGIHARISYPTVGDGLGEAARGLGVGRQDPE
jgi:hypothetical protein